MNKLELQHRLALLEAIITRSDLNYVHDGDKRGEGSLYKALETSRTCSLSSLAQSERLRARGHSR